MVGTPYWSGEWLVIKCTAENLGTGKYWARAIPYPAGIPELCKAELSGTASERTCYCMISKSTAEGYIGKTVEVDLLDEAGSVRDYVYRTVPSLPTPTPTPTPVPKCSQNVRVVTSDGASVYAHVVWGDGADEYGTTPKVFVHRYEEGKTYTVTVSAAGYEDASQVITTCVPEFTLTLEKIVVYCTQEFLVKHPDGSI
ncbi:unnamed protein product, partial [marine sediment metagenome]